MSNQIGIMERVARSFPLWEMEMDRDASIRAYQYSFENSTATGYKPIVLISDKVDDAYLESEEIFIRGMLDLHFRDGCKQSLYLLYGFKKMNGGERVILSGGLYPDFSRC